MAWHEVSPKTSLPKTKRSSRGSTWGRAQKHGEKGLHSSEFGEGQSGEQVAALGHRRNKTRQRPSKPSPGPINRHHYKPLTNHNLAIAIATTQLSCKMQAHWIAKPPAKTTQANQRPKQTQIAENFDPNTGALRVLAKAFCCLGQQPCP